MGIEDVLHQGRAALPAPRRRSAGPRRAGRLLKLGALVAKPVDRSRLQHGWHLLSLVRRWQTTKAETCAL